MCAFCQHRIPPAREGRLERSAAGSGAGSWSAGHPDGDTTGRFAPHPIANQAHPTIPMPTCPNRPIRSTSPPRPRSRHGTLLRLTVEFRTLGTQWGVIRHLADTPFFVDSQASRLIQVADHVAYAVFRRYQSRDAQYFVRRAGATNRRADGCRADCSRSAPLGQLTDGSIPGHGSPLIRRSGWRETRLAVLDRVNLP